MLPALDISKYQGTWQDRGDPIVMIKMSGGDNDLYMDPDAAGDYAGAIADGRAVGGYHFAGNTNPVAEANYFMQAMSPVAENDVYALDWELPVNTAGAVQWCLTFAETVHNKIDVWPLIYMNLNTLNSYDWSPVLAHCGLWLADWNNNPSGTIATVHTYVMQQYSDGPVYDHDEWFGTIDQFKAYGYHAGVTITSTTTTTNTTTTETTSTSSTSSTSSTTTLPPTHITTINDPLPPVTKPNPKPGVVVGPFLPPKPQVMLASRVVGYIVKFIKHVIGR